MRIEDCKVGQLVTSEINKYTIYTITKIHSRYIDVEHRPGTKIMVGGKYIEEVFPYTSLSPSVFSPLIDDL